MKQHIEVCLWLTGALTMCVLVGAAFTGVLRIEVRDDAVFCASIKRAGLETDTRYLPQYGCLVKRADHWEPSQW